MSDLVEQLRGRADWYDDAHPGTVKTPGLLRQAATALTELEQDNTKLRAQLKRESFVTACVIIDMETRETSAAVVRRWPPRRDDILQRFPDTSDGLLAAHAEAERIAEGRSP